MSEGNVRRFHRRLSSEEAKFAAECLLSVPIEERGGKAQDFYLDDPDAILPLLGILRGKLDTSPSLVRDEAEYFYRFLEKEVPGLPGELFLFDERNYFLGDAARLAGIACRVLSRREEARRWFDLSESWFLTTIDPAKNLSLLSYQRLALLTEERRFEEVLRVLPQLIAAFKSFEMAEDALKCRFLEGQALRETGQLREALVLFRETCRESQALGSGKLLGWSYVNLLQIHAFFGEVEEAFQVACDATPLLRGLENRVGLAKIQWGLGTLLRSEGKLSEAIEAYRMAQKEFAEIGMSADVAAIHLVVADLLLDAGQEPQARWEIQAALPVIEEFKLVPEGVAALSLLRQSLQNPRLNRQALRDLHGYFPDRDA